MHLLALTDAQESLEHLLALVMVDETLFFLCNCGKNRCVIEVKLEQRSLRISNKLDKVETRLRYKDHARVVSSLCRQCS